MSANIDVTACWFVVAVSNKFWICFKVKSSLQMTSIKQNDHKVESCNMDITSFRGLGGIGFKDMGQYVDGTVVWNICGWGQDWWDGTGWHYCCLIQSFSQHVDPVGWKKERESGGCGVKKISASFLKVFLGPDPTVYSFRSTSQVRWGNRISVVKNLSIANFSVTHLPEMLAKKINCTVLDPPLDILGAWYQLSDTST